MNLRLFLAAVLLIIGLASVLAQTDPQTTPTPTCESFTQTSCDECLKNVGCLWCISSKKCVAYPVKAILPPHELCPLNDARWGLCWMNFQALIISLGVVGGVIIIALMVCMFCCCKCENLGGNRFNAKMERQAAKTRYKQDERRAETKQKHDDIRKKYGMSQHNPYSRFA